MSVTLQVELSESAFSAMKLGREEMGRELVEAAVSQWYKEGSISQGKGSEILGVTRHEFLDILNRHQVSPFQETPEELAETFQRDTRRIEHGA